MVGDPWITLRACTTTRRRLALREPPHHGPTPEHPPPPRPPYALLRPRGIGTGRTPLRLPLGRLGRSWRVCGRLYGRDALHQPGDDPPRLGVGLALLV